MLANDGEDILDDMPNLLPTHYHLSRVQEFRDQALYQGRNSADVQRTLGRYFERLDLVSSRFRDKLWKLSQRTLDIVKERNYTLIVKIAKIIDAEETADEKSVAVQDARFNYSELAKKFRSIQAGPRELRQYRQQYNAAIEAAVRDIFEAYVEAKKDDLGAILDGLGWVYEDLTIVRTELVGRVPAKWKVFEHYVTLYQTQICRLLDNLMASEPDAATLLIVIEWIKAYKEKMTNEVGFPYSKLQPKLLGGKEGTLVDDYLQIIVRKVEEWMTNLYNTEKKDFVERSQAPETDAEGFYEFHGAVIMFQMISQQIDVAAESGQGKVLAAVVAECVRVMKKRQADWATLLQEEHQKQSDTPNEVPKGLFEYTTALANDQLKSAIYSDSLRTRLIPMVSKKYASAISEGLTIAEDGFLDLAKNCVSILLRMLFADLSPALSTLFTSSWYGGKEIATIMDTFREYVHDCKATLSPTLSEIFLDDLFQQFLKEYILATRNKGAKLRIPAAIDQIFDDVKVAFGFFREHLDPAIVSANFGVIELLRNLISSTQETFSSNLDALMANYHDTPAWLVEGLVKSRDDLNKNDTRAFIQVVRAYHRDAFDLAPTIMSQLR